MTARDITIALAQFHKWSPRKHLMIPNLCTYVGWEVDLAYVSDGGFLGAIEIKISVADMKREFKEKAQRHETLVGGGKSGEWRGGEYVITGTTPHCIKRFWFAVPSEIADAILPLVPEHAGLLVVSGPDRWHRYEVVVVKEAPVLKHHRKLEPKEVTNLYRLGYLRYWDLRLYGKETAAEAVA